MPDGTAVLVNRGFLPRGTDPDAPTPPAAPAGHVEVVGRARPTQERGFLGPEDPDSGRLAEAQRIDIPRLADQVDEPLLPAYLELTSTSPEPSPPQPAVLPLPALDEGPHLSYAIQWFLFSAMAVVGWFLAVRRSAVTARRAEQQPEPTPAPTG
jgi:cytochrome oxidase assembly protein ShyY1